MSTTEYSGTLVRDARYLIRIPDDWNGILLNDLDYVATADSSARRSLLARGYGLSGTSRLQTGGPLNIDNQLSVLDAVDAAVGRPRYVIQLGCSGGGNTALWMGELHPDRVDGTIPMCGASSLLLRSLWLDLLFSLRHLLAPDEELPLTSHPAEVNLGPRGDAPEVARWDALIRDAQESALGRARTALAIALAQWPTWAGMARVDAPPPDDADPGMVRAALGETARAAVGCAAAFAMDATPPYPTNDDVDYVAAFANADPSQKRIVTDLYREAGADPDVAVAADLRSIQDAERVGPRDREPAGYYERSHTGRIAVPTLHATTMDAAVPPVVMRGYEARARSTGTADLYRQAFVQRANHCGFADSEILALVETLVGRLATGDWADSTTPDRLNALAHSLGDDEPAFIEYVPPVLNRATLFAAAV